MVSNYPLIHPPFRFYIIELEKNKMNSNLLSFFGRIILCFFAFVMLQAQTSQTPYFYYYTGSKQYLELNTQYAHIQWNGAPESIQDLPEPYQDLCEIESVRIEQAYDRLNLTDEMLREQPIEAFGVLRFTQNLSEAEYWEVLEGLEEMESVIATSPYFKKGSSEQIGMANRFLVRLHEAEEVALLENLAENHQIKVIGQNKFMPLWYVLTVDKESNFNAMEAANYFYETGLFDKTEPEFLVKGKTTSNDTYYSELWSHENTGQYVEDFGFGTPGIDMNVPEAWAMTKGEGVQVAIMDQGILMNHEDLVGQFYNDGFDALGGSTPQVLHDYHGTPIAGIIGAIEDNGLGVAGIAPDCKMTSISHTLYLSDPIQTFADGINWAWQNGADVMSNSWAHNSLVSSVLEEALNNAIQYGRGGLGTVVVHTAGNDDGDVIYPSSAVPELLVVGAMNPDGSRWTDGGSGSNYGTHLDVVAPGAKIQTTDYNNTSSYDLFWATSCATPHGAGVAALVLSVAPCLSGRQVRDIIESTAQKVGSYTYNDLAERPNGTWSNRLGYGLVDAEAAVLLAMTYDSDNDGVCSPFDICDGFDDNLDADIDGVPDGCDICVGFDDNLDVDVDGVPDGCDICPNSTFNVDADNDGVCDDVDICLGFADSLDADIDGVPDGCDICVGFVDSLDVDVDGIPDGCDICPNSTFNIDADNDGVCDDVDICLGFDNNLIGSPCNDGDTCTINDIFDNSCNCIGVLSDSDEDGICDVLDECPVEAGNTATGCPAASVALRVFLQGALLGSENDTLMKNDLSEQGLLPLTEPYSSLSTFTHYGSGGGEATIDSILMTYEVVDWLMLELRSALDSTQIVSTKSVLLQKDGHVVDVLGNQEIVFDSIAIDSYYLVVKHRNHLGIMTQAPYLMDGSNLIDFTQLSMDMWGEEACVEMESGHYAMWAGNINADSTIVFQGLANDANGVFFMVLSSDENATSTPNFVEEGYYIEDANLDGRVIYQGLSNEVNTIFFNVLSSSGNPLGLSNYILREQMP